MSMRMYPVSKRKARGQLMSRVAAIAILTGSAAGCSSDVSRFSEPFYSGSTSNQQAIITSSGSQPVDEVYTGSIGSRGRRHIPSVNDVPGRPSGSAVATHNPAYRDPGGSVNSIGTVTESRLDPLPPLPAQVSRGRGRDVDAKAAEALQPSDYSTARMPPLPVSARPGQRADLTPAYARQTAALPMRRPSSRDSDPIETGSLPPASEADRAPARAGGGSGWSTTGGSLVTVGGDESGHTMARRYGVPLKAILVANNMSDPNGIRPGQRVVIPTYIYSSANPAQSADKDLPQGRDAFKLLQGAPVPKGKPGYSRARVAVTQGSTSRDLSDGHYTVRPGDSVAAIAQKFNISPSGLRSVNDLDADDLLWIGQKLRIPSASGGTQVASLQASDAPVVSDQNSGSPALTAVPSPKPLANAARQRLQNREAQSGARGDANKAGRQAEEAREPAPSRIVTASRNDTSAKQEAAPRSETAKSPDMFAWPAKGPVISRFGRKANGERNDGINISVPRGAPVHAAEKGVVIYSGNELKGYGNLVLVRHAEGWVSAYAHNGKLSVERGDAVRKGQVIATAGDTGSVSEPQVHFELRRNSKPVDPMPLLARK